MIDGPRLLHSKKVLRLPSGSLVLVSVPVSAGQWLHRWPVFLDIYRNRVQAKVHQLLRKKYGVADVWVRLLAGTDTCVWRIADSGEISNSPVAPQNGVQG